MKKLTALALTLLIAISTLFSLVACQKADFTVGICQLVQHEALDKATQGFIDALNEKMQEAGKTVKILNKNASGETAQCSTIINNFVSQNVDLILANATPALQSAVNATETIPVLGTAVTEYGIALGIDNFSGTTGKNVSGTSDLAPLDQQAQMVKDLCPTAQTVGILYCSAEANSNYQFEVIKGYLEALSFTVNKYSFVDSNNIYAQVTQACDECDVLYVPTDNTAASCAETIYNVVSQKRIPLIAGEENLCKTCGIATLSIDYYQLGRITGQMAAEILLNGKDISTMKIELDENPVYKYNEELCTSLGIDVPDNYVKIEK